MPSPHPHWNKRKRVERKTMATTQHKQTGFAHNQQKKKTRTKQNQTNKQKKNKMK